MANYSQWYIEATARVARDAFKTLCAHPFGNVFLYFKPNGLAFAVAHEDEQKPDGFELVTGERIPGDRTVEGLTYWVRERTASVPVLPGD